MRVLSLTSKALFVSTILSLMLGLSGCSTTPKSDGSSASRSVPQTAPRPRETTTTPVESTRPVYAGPWEDPSSPLYNRTIYFDYDSAEIKPQYLDLMRTHARYLGSNTSVKVTLEGNTDERGTREYNLALGDQRAETVRRFMLAEGVLPSQMTTLSYGEERPADGGHSETAWRQNRRVIIQY
ncbi:peptidoglycan-associated lipoprotein [Thiorhodococcus drewsii AZ1]|uniref:Peptidoglycan-associated lipoprotein n=1 Tax=Thiorhodococcus drewsii AZ1 TaxID=765913 RepID=G2E8A4_9GAMM|nr:peptidoglycan-associated lipoprotein Pal [Thiorhodococcus drewsii]EGV27671.1 peptidoglycan-associated lipoprotein [Thiorhodococcus drewsii AZ1]